MTVTRTSTGSLFAPLSVAIRGKGISALFKRARIIGTHYGLTAFKMDLALAQFAELLQLYGCSATFPITGVALARNSAVIREYQSQGIEFAIHGYTHVDYSALSLQEQLAHLDQARCAFEQSGVRATGFRCPYLRWSADTLTALRQQGLAYDSSQSLAWDVVNGYETPTYRRVLNFCGAESAGEYPSLPHLKANLICIPYSLPDDEALVERLALETTEQMINIWLAILRRTHQRGELFTLALHPERIAACRELLAAVLSEAQTLAPGVWIARLDEIAAWWRARAGANVEITDAGDGESHLVVAGPSGTTVLARAVEVDAPTVSWADGYQRVMATAFTIRAPLRPFIGVSPDTSPKLTDFLRQQGYIVEISEESHRYSHYFDQAEFAAEHKRPLLAQIEGTDRPLVRLGRWPNSARSALAITGDIEALTLWDYGLRFFGR